MKKILALTIFSSAIGMSAQVLPDSTDIFFGHVNLEEATVTGVTGSTRLKDSPAAVSLVTKQTLNHSVGSNIVSAIAHQPGMSELTTGSGISKPIIRGLGFNRIVCLTDGVRQEGQQWGDEHGLELDGAGVGSVEILKGPASLMYGSDAMAGVVIFKPQPVRPLGSMGGSVEAGYQTNSGLWNYSLNFAGNKGGFVWDGRFSQKAAHAYKNKVDGYIPGSQFSEQAARVLLGINKSWGYSHLIFSHYHLLPSIIEGERDETTGALEAPEGWSGRSYRRQLPFQHVNHTKLVLDNKVRIGSGSLQAIVGYQQNRRKEYEESAKDFSLYFQQHTLNYDLRYTLSELRGWKLVAGIGGMYQRSLNKGEEYLIPEYKLFDIGGYLTGSRSWEKFILSGGIRLDHRHVHSYELYDEGSLRFGDFRRNWNALTGSIGGVWKALRGLNVRLNLSRGFRAPNLAELGSNGVHEGTMRYEKGNSALKAENSLQADLGMDYTNSIISVQAALFLNRINNYIYSCRNGESIDGIPVYKYTSGDARLWGFEVGADFHPIHSLHFENTFSYVNAVQLHQPAASKYLPQTPAPRWRSELKWELLHNAMPLFKSKVAIENAFVSLGVESYFRQSHVFLLDNTETPTPFYCLIDIAAGTDIFLKKRKIAELFMCVDNLLNRTYQNHLSRLKYTDINVQTGRMGIYNPGRNFTVKLIFHF